MKRVFLWLVLGYLTISYTQAQDLLDLLPDEQAREFITASFKTNRVINLHSLENTAFGVLDFKISHRFGFLSGGAYELFGLDQSTIRFGFDYGLTDRVMIGLGRSSFEKTYDGFAKYKFLRQSTGKGAMPVTAAFLATIALKSSKFPDPNRENYFSSRLYYTYQLIVGRKFNESFSFQLSPSLVHRNLVATLAENNDVWAIGAGGRIRLGKRIAFNAEYIYVLPDQLAPGFKNSLSVGMDIETGGHVFQVHLTNSTSMIEKGFIGETTGDPFNGDFRLGFNISRVFTIVKPKEF